LCIDNVLVYLGSSMSRLEGLVKLVSRQLVIIRKIDVF
jgi:hypothetical protein